MPKSNRANAIPGGSPRSPAGREGNAQLGAPYESNADRQTRADQDYAPLLAAVASLPGDQPPTVAELVAVRRLVPPTPSDVARASLSSRFLVPPFSVLDARQGYWQKRKKMWLELGIQSELGRGEVRPGNTNLPVTGYDPSGAPIREDLHPISNNGLLGISHQARSHYRTNATVTGSPMPATNLRDGRTQRGDGRCRPLAQTFGSGSPGDLAAGFRANGSLKEQETNDAGLTWGELDKQYTGEGGNLPAQSGTSIFDPVLCELAYRWFCPTGGSVLDPFAGGSVRGIVAAKTGRAYAGVDLRPEQAEANYAQAEVICPDADLTWVVGDSTDITELLGGQNDENRYDLVFSCPPYADLERYSDDPRDLSTMDYPAFLEAYLNIVVASCTLLNNDRFAVFVVGDVRDTKTGLYRGFVGDTIEAFRAAGLELYNEAVLVTAVGSLPIRVGKQFAGYRKLGKTHQNVLVFLKGDAGRAAAACGEVDVDDLEMPECVEGSVALCRQDVSGTMVEGWLMDKGGDASHLYLPPVESYLLVDVLRGQARAGGRESLRAWLGTADGWKRVDDGVELTYLVGDRVYLNRAVFPDAAVPAAAPPSPKKVR